MTPAPLVLQTTIAAPFTLKGVGVHSGVPVSATFIPAQADCGITFVRLGPNGAMTALKALSSSVGSTDLCTVLGISKDRSVGTIEHVMAALYALGIDNLVIEIDGGEMPVMDGSSRTFVEAIEKVGIRSLGESRRYIRILKEVRVTRGTSWAEFSPYDGMYFDVEIDFDCPLIGRQRWQGDINAMSFGRELSRARTFGFMRDVESLWAAGLALGSSLENSVVINDDNQLANQEGLRYPDEFVRHKALDAVGDLALAGSQFMGCYRSYRGGHALNAMALNALIDDPSAYDIVETGIRIPAIARERLSVSA